MGFLDRLLGPPGKAKFANMFIAALKKAGDPRRIRFERAQFRLVFSIAGQDVGVLNLANLYREYCAIEKPGRDNRLREMVRAALSHLKKMPSDFSDARHDILPKLWTRGTIERLRMGQKSGNDRDMDWPGEPVGNHLYLSLAYDLPESVRSISGSDLEQWGVTYWEAREIALKNLSSLEFAYTSVGGQMYVSSTGDSYDSTRLILAGLFDELEVPGQPIVMVPNRDTLIVTGDDSPSGLKMMAEFSAQQMREQPRPMSAVPLILNGDDSWSDWYIADNHHLAEEYRQLRMLWLAGEYNDQKQLLDEINARSSIRCAVSGFFVGEKGGRTESFCLWPVHSHVLLPETDRVLLCRGGGKEVFASVCLKSVLEFSPQLLEPVSAYPPLYRAARQPTRAELEAIGVEELNEQPPGF